MPRLINTVFILLFFFVGTSVFSQVSSSEPDTSHGVILRKAISGGLLAHTAGWGANFRIDRRISAFKKSSFEFEGVTMKSPKEVKTINPYFNNSKSYVFGKLNSIFILRGGYGFHHQLNRKPLWGGVEVRYFYYGGASIGFAKPVYLYILNFTSIYYEYTLTTEKFNPEEHFLDNIYGRAPFSKGFSEIKLYPGIYLKGGFNFDFSHVHEKVRTLEAGFVLDLYPIPIPIMAFRDKYHYFLNLYLSFNFGKKYNRKLKESRMIKKAQKAYKKNEDIPPPDLDL